MEFEHHHRNIVGLGHAFREPGNAFLNRVVNRRAGFRGVSLRYVQQPFLAKKLEAPFCASVTPSL